jgi:hypothetical protein
MENRTNRPPLVLTRLWQKESATGRTYFVGRLGGAKVLLMPVRDRVGEDGPTHELLLTEAASREGGAP